MNHFDRLTGYQNVPQQMDGIFGDIKNALKKVDQVRREDPIRKAAKKVAHQLDDNRRKGTAITLKKIAPDKVEKKLVKLKDEIKASPIFAIAVTVVAAVYLGPAVGAILGNLGITAPLVIKGATFASEQAISDALKRAQQSATDKKTKDAIAKMQNEIKAIDEINRKLASDPEFKKIIAGMQAKGYTEKQIIAEWQKSDLAKKYATLAAEKVLAPAVKTISNNAGVGVAGKELTESVASSAVKQVAPKPVNYWLLVPIGLAVAKAVL